MDERRTALDHGNGDAHGGGGHPRWHAAIGRLAGVLGRVRVWWVCRHWVRDVRTGRYRPIDLDPHCYAIAGGCFGRDSGDRDTATDQGAAVNGSGGADVPAAGPERPGPSVFYRHLGPNAKIDTQTGSNTATATNVWYLADRRMPDGGK